MLLLPPDPEDTRCHVQKVDAFLQRQVSSHQTKADPTLLQGSAWSTGITESGGAEQEHPQEKAAAAQFVQGFYGYSKLSEQHPEWFCPLFLYHGELLSGLTTNWEKNKEEEELGKKTKTIPF